MTAIRKCMCKDCMNPGVYAFGIKNRGERNGYLCEYHAQAQMPISTYSQENHFRLGNVKANGFTFSKELETMSPTLYARANLLTLGFIPTHDCTVDCEFKSPIYNGLNAISKQCLTVESLKNAGEITIDSHCGTHFHVGHIEHINPETMAWIRRYYNSIFVPLSDYISNQSLESQCAFWGREIGGRWAWAINMHSRWDTHENFVNMQHDYTIEFRLPKFVTAKQYMNIVRFCKDAVNAVINNFVLHFEDEFPGNVDSRESIPYRKHKAEVTANKIIKLYEKYLQNVEY